MNVKLYQITKSTRNLFMAFDWVEKHSGSVYPEDYTLAYECTVDDETGLEDLYRRFNLSHPSDYRCRSMSVSDIVVVHGSSACEDGSYFCDTIGFRKIDFVPADPSEE